MCRGSTAAAVSQLCLRKRREVRIQSFIPEDHTDDIALVKTAASLVLAPAPIQYLVCGGNCQPEISIRLIPDETCHDLIADAGIFAIEQRRAAGAQHQLQPQTESLRRAVKQRIVAAPPHTAVQAPAAAHAE